MKASLLSPTFMDLRLSDLPFLVTHSGINRITDGYLFSADLNYSS